MKKTKYKFRPTFDFSCNMAEIIPINCKEVVPGEIVRQSTDVFMRTQPLATPPMQKVKAEIFHMYVPCYEVWEEWEDFMTGGDNGTDSPTPPTVEIPVGGFLIGSLADYLGLPCDPATAGQTVSAMPFRAYQKIYNYWFRDSQLITPAAISYASGADTTTSLSLQMGCWNRDRFTAARPDPQLGPSVTIPLTGNAPVISDGTTPNFTGAGQTNNNLQGSNSAGVSRLNGAAGFTSVANLIFGNNTGLDADLSGVSAVDIEDLREASAFQRMLENLNAGGARYVERIQQAFGVPLADYRLQEPELLGSGSSIIQFSEVLQTAEGTDPVGTMKGHGISGIRSNRYKYRCPDYGFVISLLVVRPVTKYFQGIDRMWNRPTRLDYFQPELAFLGWGPVFNKEVKASHASPNGVFGYCPAWDEYRYIPSRVAGEFRPGQVLGDWTQTREFTTDPALNATFVRSNPSTRIFSDTNSDQLYVSTTHNITSISPIPKVKTPKLL